MQRGYSLIARGADVISIAMYHLDNDNSFRFICHFIRLLFINTTPTSLWLCSAVTCSQLLLESMFSTVSVIQGSERKPNYVTIASTLQESNLQRGHRQNIEVIWHLQNEMLLFYAQHCTETCSFIFTFSI